MNFEERWPSNETIWLREYSVNMAKIKPGGKIFEENKLRYEALRQNFLLKILKRMKIICKISSEDLINIENYAKKINHQ
jgi:hypothetical protein